jgi:hypothetical protein
LHRTRTYPANVIVVARLEQQASLPLMIQTQVRSPCQLAQVGCRLLKPSFDRIAAQLSLVSLFFYFTSPSIAVVVVGWNIVILCVKQYPSMRHPLIIT